MFDYGEACPISMATSVLCERWTLQIIRELLFGSARYSETQTFIPNISPSLLRNRLRFLEAEGVVAPPVYARNMSRWLGISAFATDNPSLGRGYADF
jgi:DNA-binding HxlR family transcriptional regulator